MSKHSLMLSAATVALLAGQAFADTTVTTATTTALTTGTLPAGAGSAGNIIIKSGGSVAADNAGAGAITINSNNYVYSDGVISNKGAVSTSSSIAPSGIRIDMTTNPNMTGLSFLNVASTTINGAGIYLDGGSALDLTGSAVGKHGIWLNGTTGTFTGDITTFTGSTQSITGDQGQGVTVDAGTTLAGNLTLGGKMTLSQTTSLSTTASSLYGVLMDGRINGNIVVPSGGSIVVSGEGAQGMLIAGTGVGGNITIGGSLATTSISSTATTTTTNTSVSATTIYPEAGTALSVEAGVTNGIGILGNTVSGGSTAAGSVTTQGGGPAVSITPSSTISAPFTIGVYTGYTAIGTTYSETTDPGFSFINRGSISATPANVVNSATSTSTNVIGMSMSGSSAAYPILTGGFFNSGGLQASVGTTGTTANPVTATALSIGGYTVLGENLEKVRTDQAALVNSNAAGAGAIQAQITGTRGGVATAITIDTHAHVPSLINSGTISATVNNQSDLTLNGTTNPVQAYAIVDKSGTLTSIYNSGVISAQATVLNNNSQIAQAINLAAGTSVSPSGSGVTITDQSVGATGAKIIGDILFGTGNNQIINVAGIGPGALAAIIKGNISYGLLGSGSSSGDHLNIGNYGQVAGIVTAPDGVSVDIQSNGLLLLQNTTTALSAVDFHVANLGTVNLGVSESVATAGGMVQASNSVTLDSGSKLGVAYDSFVPQGTDPFVLFSAPHVAVPSPGVGLYIAPGTIATYNTALQTNVINGGSLPFLFQSATLTQDTVGGLDRLVLTATPKNVTQLGLTPGSYGYQLFTLANVALSKDDVLGAAMVNGVGTLQQAQTAYDSFAPNVTGGSRAIAISITDQATGVVGAHQRALRMYGRDSGDETLWGEEFVQMIKDPGRGVADPNTISTKSVTGFKVQPGFKDHGFGFALGMDGGSPKYGWYGGAFTFYAGDVGELARNSHTNQQWYVLSGYTAWRGKGLFFDSKLDVGYSHIDGKRYISLAIPQGTSGGQTVYSTYTREADNKHPATMLSGGFTTGGIFAYGATTLMPQVSVDGLLMREEGYTETQPTGSAATVGDGFDLTVQPYYAHSLRVFLGTSIRYDLDLWDFYLQPEARVGYRYDLFSDPVKLKAAFAHSGAAGAMGTPFTIIGPDPSQGNFVLGGSLAATTDTWTMGFNFDLVKGSNGALEQVGTLNLLGRI